MNPFKVLKFYQKRIFVFFLLTIIIGGGILGYRWYRREITTPPTAISEMDAEEYSILSTVIQEHYGISEVKLIVIKEKTNAFHITEVPPGERIEDNLDYIKKEMPEIEKETLNSYKNKNLKSYQLSKNFNFGIDYLFFSDKEMKEIFVDGRGWEEFYEKYPDSQGTIELARVGFNSKKNQALVYIGNQFDWLAGVGEYVLLIKENNTWKIKNSTRAWVS